MSISVDKQIDNILDMYEMPEDSENIEEIRMFLEEHDHLFPILKEAKGKILSIFGEYVRIYLELYHDIEEGWNQLFIIIKSPYNTEKAFELENRLGKEWFLGKIKDTRGDLSISEEPL